jgi:hypothetical protein
MSSINSKYIEINKKWFEKRVEFRRYLNDGGLQGHSCM